jgi:hypothetical protein
MLTKNSSLAIPRQIPCAGVVITFESDKVMVQLVMNSLKILINHEIWLIKGKLFAAWTNWTRMKCSLSFVTLKRNAIISAEYRNDTRP